MPLTGDQQKTWHKKDYPKIGSIFLFAVAYAVDSTATIPPRTLGEVPLGVGKRG